MKLEVGIFVNVCECFVLNVSLVTTRRSLRCLHWMMLTWRLTRSRRWSILRR